MNVLAVVEPNTLTGTELRQELRGHRELWSEVRLLSADADPDLVVAAAGLLPPLNAASGEVGLYSSGDFGNPAAMVDYLVWGSTDQVRYPVAIAAGLWPEEEVVVVDANATGLAIVDRTQPGPQGWSSVTG